VVTIYTNKRALPKLVYIYLYCWYPCTRSWVKVGLLSLMLTPSPHPLKKKKER